MKVMIAGGSGIIGVALTQALLAQQHQVWVLSRNPRSGRIPPGAEGVLWDGKTTQGWGHLAGEMDAVVNLAGANLGEKPWTARQKALIRASRLQAGEALVLAIQGAARKPAVFIQASAIGAYGPSDDRLLDEDSPLGNDFLSTVAREWEASTRPVEEEGVKRVILRTGLVLAARGGFMTPLLLAFRSFAGGSLGSGKQWWSWIHIQDHIGAVLFLMERGAGGVYNLTGPNPCRMEEFGRELGKVIRRPYWLPAPAFGLRLLFGEMSTLILDGQRVIPRRLLDLGYAFRYPELRPALENLYSRR